MCTPKGRMTASYRTWRCLETPVLAGTEIVFFLSDYPSRPRRIGHCPDARLDLLRSRSHSGIETPEWPRAVGESILFRGNGERKFPLCYRTYGKSKFLYSLKFE